MNTYVLSTLVCLSTIISTVAQVPRLAFCAVPVADVVSHPLASADTPEVLVDYAYQQLPISWGPDTKDKEACPRIHQLLLHEEVTILDETPHEALVSTDACFILDANKKPQSVQGWTLKKNLCDMERIGRYSLLPCPLAWNKKTPLVRLQKTVALASPFMDEYGTLYCAGTQFLIRDRTDDAFIAVAFDHFRSTFVELTLPEQLCVYESRFASLDQKRRDFCSVITLWSTIPHTSIPLVWGGCSIGHTYYADDCYATTRTSTTGEALTVWERPHYGNLVHMGVDASGVILRAAQLVGIPYFCRNSTTAASVLTPYDLHQPLEEGDLVWVPGALLVITNLHTNTIATAMSYTSGYGILIELPLDQLFKNIRTYGELIDAYRTNTPLTLLNHDGSSARTVETFKILKLF